MEPVRGTKKALDMLVSQGDTAVAVALMRMGRAARRVVPSCVGLSLSFAAEDLTLTLVATREELAAAGPAPQEAASIPGAPPEAESPLDERRWQEEARAGAATGVASTLTLPVVREGHTLGSVNVYAALPDAFEGRREQLADALGVSASAAVGNADLAFDTRRAAAEAPARLADNDDIDVAVGLIAATQQVDVTVAEERLRDAARRTGLSVGRAARVFRYIVSS